MSFLPAISARPRRRRVADQGLAPQPSHGHGPVRHRQGHQSPGARLDQLLRGLLSLRVVLLGSGASTSISCDGPCTNSNDSGAGQAGHGGGWTPCNSASPPCSRTGTCCHPPNAGLWEPYDGRPSRTVLREREGEAPSRYSPGYYRRRAAAGGRPPNTLWELIALPGPGNPAGRATVPVGACGCLKPCRRHAPC